MRKQFEGALVITSLLLLTFTACTKKDIITRPVPIPDQEDSTGNPRNPPAPPVQTQFAVSLKAFVEVGSVMYDSIPANITVTSWDSANIAYTQELDLEPGANQVKLEKKYPKFRFRLHTWGVDKTMDYTREQLQEGLPVVIGGKREPKTLRGESTWLLIQGEYRIQSRIDYHYNGNGSLNTIDYHQKKPQSADLLHYWTDHFYYNGSQVTRITRHDENNKPVIFTDFTYTGSGFLLNIEQDSYGNKTYAYVQQGADTEHEIVEVDFLFDNGQAMTSSMKFKNGNKVSETATSSTGAGEGGTFQYDHHINPYHQLNWPDMYFRNSSKNNPLTVDKGYSGAIPSVVIYKTVYTYDNDGYPMQVIKSYKSGGTGEHLYDRKTLYFY